MIRATFSKAAVDSLRRQLRVTGQSAANRRFRTPQLGSALMPTAILGANVRDIHIGKPDGTHSSGSTQTYSIWELTTGGSPQDTTDNLANVYQESGFPYETGVMHIIWEVDTEDSDYRFWSWPIELQDCEDAVTTHAGSVSTTDATTTTMITVTTATDTAYHVVAQGIGVNTDDYSEVGSYYRVATFKNDGGTLSQVGSTTEVHAQEDVAGWNVGLSTSGTNIRVRVTGAAATNINWTGTLSVTKVS